MKRWSLSWAARFVAPFEGFAPYAYQDSGGVWTIAYGRTNGVYPGMRCTVAQGRRWLEQDLRTAAQAVDRYVKRKLSIRQRIAFISFAYNCGIGALAESTALERFNEGDIKGAAEALQWWDKDAAGQVLLGLQRRRKAEAWLLLHPRALRRNPNRPLAKLQGKAHR